MSLIAVQIPSGRPTEIAGSSSVSKSPANARSKSPSSPSGSTRGQEADLAEVDGEHRHAGAGVAAQRGEDRAVAAEHDAEVDVVGAVGLELEPVARRRARACAVSSASKRSVDAGAPGGGDQLAQRGRGLGGAAVGEHARRLHTLDLRAAARVGTAPGGRPRPSHTNVSRLPAGPGRPDGAKPSTAAPSARARAATDDDRLARSAGSRTTPPLPTRSRPTSNCGLTIARQSKRSAAQASTAGRTLVSEMNETSMTIRSGAVRQLVRRQRAGVDALDHGHALVAAQRPVELAVGDVERDDVRRAALQQAVGEAAGRGADVERAAPGDRRRRARRARWRA